MSFYFRDLDTNQLENLEEDTLEELPFLKQIRIGKNAWNCDCKILYLAKCVKISFQIFVMRCGGSGAIHKLLLVSTVGFETVHAQFLMMSQNVVAPITLLEEIFMELLL